MAESSSNGRRRFSDKWGKHELDVLAVLSSAFPQWLTSRQIAQRVKAYADSYGELADQAAKAAFAKQFQRDRAKLAAMGIAIESRQPEYSSKSDGQDFASYRLQLGEGSRRQINFTPDELPILAIVNYLAQTVSVLCIEQNKSLFSSGKDGISRSIPRVQKVPVPGLGLDAIAPGLGTQVIDRPLLNAINQQHHVARVILDGTPKDIVYSTENYFISFVLQHPGITVITPKDFSKTYSRVLTTAERNIQLIDTTHIVYQTLDEYMSDVSEEAITVSTGTRQKGRKSSANSNQITTEVDRRLKLLLFLAAHLDEEFSLHELAQQFIGHCTTDSECNTAMSIIDRDIRTLTTVSDDGEVAGSQFFDIDWSLFEQEKTVCATNSLGLDRLAGITNHYFELLIAITSYLCQSTFLPQNMHDVTIQLYNHLVNEYHADEKHSTNGKNIHIQLAEYEMKPQITIIIDKAIQQHQSLDIAYYSDNFTSEHCIALPLKVYSAHHAYYGLFSRNNPEDPQHPIFFSIRLSLITDCHISHDTRENTQLITNTQHTNSEDITPCNHTNIHVDLHIDKSLLQVLTPYNESIHGIAVQDDNTVFIQLSVAKVSDFIVFCLANAPHILGINSPELQEAISHAATNVLNTLK